MAVPMPSKRRSLVVQTSMDAYTPPGEEQIPRPDTSSGSEGEGSGQGDSQGTPTSSQGSINMEHWISRAIHGSTTSSTTSSSSTQSGGSGAARLSDLTAQTHIENHCAPPDVTTSTSEHSIQVERPQGSTSRSVPKYGNAELMETGDGVPVSSRVSAKIQQLVNTLKRPKRPPLREFFVDDFEELLEVLQPDPNQPKPEGAQMLPMRGEQLGVVTNWPPSLEAALQRWGTISPKAPCLTTMDTNGKPLYILTYGKLWTRSMKVAYNILHKLGSKQEPMVRPGDRVALVFPNNDPAAFMVAFYGCLLAEVVPVPIEVPLTRKDAGSQQIGFLLGSCGVTVALTSDACHKGLPKSPTGEIPQFKGNTKKPPYKELPIIQAILCNSLSVMNMMHVISIPYSLMKVNPLSWIQKVCQYKAKVSCVKSRDMHWALVAHRDQRDVNLSSLRMLIVADGSNPWSISSCDAFLNVFQSKGLRPEVICPCASSPEALTVAIRKPTDDSNQPPGRGVLSMQGLSYGVIRVDSEEKLSVLTVQDVGTVMPGGLMCVVKPDGVPQICRTDEIGELCVCSIATGTSYYGLSGMTKNTFEVFPMCSSGAPVSEYPFARTGLLGFIGPGGLVFIAGKMDGLMVVSGRRHNADDIVATALAVEPMKFVYRGRIAVFSISVLHDERVVIVAEQRPDSTEEDSFQWMSRVLQLKLYLTVALPSSEALWVPDGLPVPVPEIGPASVMVGNLVSGKRIAQASGRDLGQIEDNDQARKLHGIDLIAAFYGCLYAGCVPITVRPPHPQNIATTLPTVKMIVEVSRSACIMTSQVICKLLRSKEASAAVDVRTWPPVLDTDDLPKKRPPQVYKPSDPDTLAYLDFSVSTTGMLAGVKMSHTATSAFCRSIKLQCELYPSREVAICLDPYCGLGFVLWCLCSVYSGHQSILIPPSELEINPALWLLAVSQYKVRDTFCSYSVMELCTKGLGLQTESLKSRGLDLSRVRTCVVVAEERPRISLTQSFSKLFKDLGLHPRAVSTSFGCRVNLAICLQGSFGRKGVSSQFATDGIRQKLPEFYSYLELPEFYSYLELPEFYSYLELPEFYSYLELPEFYSYLELPEFYSYLELPEFYSYLELPEFYSYLELPEFYSYLELPEFYSYLELPEFYSYLELPEFYSYLELPEFYSYLELPEFYSYLELPEFYSYLELPEFYANPETKGPLGDSHLGEVWVHSAHNSSGYFTIYGEESLQSDHFNSHLSFGDTQTIWARTGYLGFLRRTELTDASGERHDALYVVGALDEAMELRGSFIAGMKLRFSAYGNTSNFTVLKIGRSSLYAVFTWTNLLVVVVELDGSEQEALDLVPLVTNVVLEEHYLIVGVVVVVDIGVIPINSRGEKQRMHLRDGFLADQLDPIYVAYNM
ncbi:UNVERIFIED_CONTAM: hypothetical protein FKN15_031704 [Acipenser sinensis]